MKKKQFLKLPEYPGGNEEYKKYILDNLHYPAAAIEHNIEGVVHLSAEVDDEGNILTVRVDKGIGFGCDEEAVRLVEGIHFGGVKNRGLRVKTTRKFRVLFSLKGKSKVDGEKMEISYSFRETGKTEKSTEKKPDHTAEANKFSYTIVFGKE